MTLCMLRGHVCIQTCIVKLGMTMLCCHETSLVASALLGTFGHSALTVCNVILILYLCGHVCGTAGKGGAEFHHSTIRWLQMRHSCVVGEQWGHAAAVFHAKQCRLAMGRQYCVRSLPRLRAGGMRS